MEHPGSGDSRRRHRFRLRFQLIVVFVAALIYLGCATSPPNLMDDVDAVQAQIARNMLESGDWVTARLDGIAYLEKSPLKYWLIAISYAIFGVHDWAARLPGAFAVILLCWVTARFAMWAFDAPAGLRAGLILAAATGLWLFTRILIPDAMLTLSITLAMWAFLRALDEEETRPRLWAHVFWAAIAVGLLLKGLIAAVFPVGGALVFLLVSRSHSLRELWKKLRPVTGILLLLAIAAPWHVLATLRNPPYFDFTMHSEEGSYRGFFWFYFFNEHVLRFLNRRFPRDYNTVPRVLFWAFHLLWLFPWSVYFPACFRLKFRGEGRAERTRLLALCWTGFILVFFTFSTTQEYYSMPCYPALALLLACAIGTPSTALRIGHRAGFALVTAAFLAVMGLLAAVWNLPAPGDIAAALTQHPEAYTLSLGHMGDLTIQSFAYLKLPLVVAGIAFFYGMAAWWRGRRRPFAPVLGLSIMMVLFFHAARLALIAFDPYLGSRDLAQALDRAPAGKLIVDDQYYAFSSVFFYSNRTALLLRGRVNNLVYGSYAPGAPQVFMSDPELPALWRQQQRWYLVAAAPDRARIEALVGQGDLHVVAESGGKFLFTNLP